MLISGMGNLIGWFSDVIHYENSVQDKDAVFFGGEEKGYTKKD